MSLYIPDITKFLVYK